MLPCKILSNLQKLVETMDIVDKVIIKKESENTEDKKKNRDIKISKVTLLIEKNKQKPSTSGNIYCKFKKEKTDKRYKKNNHVQFKLCEIKAKKMKRLKDTSNKKYLQTGFTRKTKKKVMLYLYSEVYSSCSS